MSLSTRSADFRVRWAAHNVKLRHTYVKMLHHPLIGDLTLTYESLHLPTIPGQRTLVCTAEPGSKSQEALNLLASRTTTPNTAVKAAGEHRS